MGSESCFITKKHLNEQILGSPWSEYPLPVLHRACRDGDVQTLLYLVIQGDRLEVFRSVNEQDPFLMWTPAHWAAYFGQLECLMRLVSCGINLDVTDGRLKQTTAHVAAFGGNALVLDWVLQAGVYIEKKDSLGETAVHKAVRGESVECLQVLQNHGADMNLPNSSHQTPYHIACSLGMKECLEYLKTVDVKPIESSRVSKRSLDEDCEEEQIKKPRTECIASSGPISMSNGLVVPHHENKELLSMLEANGQYPLVSSTTQSHPDNGYVNGDSDMQIDHHSHSNKAQHPGYLPLFQTPTRCHMICGHLQ